MPPVPPCTAPTFTFHPSWYFQSTFQFGTDFPPLTVLADGTATLTYQWYSNTDNSKIDGTLLSGETNMIYTPLNTVVGDLYYFCVVSNDCGKDTSAVSGMHSVTAVIDGCNDITSISGKITYGDTLNTDINTKTTTVGSQTWSAHVFVSGCNKYNFVGGSEYDVNSDCRISSPDYRLRTYSMNGINYGDIFTWCAVTRYAASLCPSPWRVPTSADFCTLDYALGGPSTCPERGQSHSTSGVAAKYYNTGSSNWGAVRGGYVKPSNSESSSGQVGYYWSSDELLSPTGYGLYVGSSFVIPQHTNGKAYGYALRCVRDN
jgi:uncharacterized protein (TIGR02145 family)